MRGVRLLVGFVVMGVAVPLVLFKLLHLTSTGQLLTIAATTFLTWGVADLGARLLERPRLKNRSPGDAIRQWERQQTDGSGPAGSASDDR